MQYVMKLGAPAFLIAAAFAVAFGVLVSSSAEAQTVPGKTVKVVFGSDTDDLTGNNNEFEVDGNSDPADNRFRISTDSSADGVFTSSTATNDGKALSCADNEACDAQTTELDEDGNKTDRFDHAFDPSRG